MLAAATFSTQLLSAQTDTEQVLHSAVAARLQRATQAQITRLVAEGRLLGSSAPEPAGSLRLQFAPLFADAIHADITSLEPAFAVEILFLVAAPERAREIDEKLLTVLQSVSTMEGIAYYSETRGRMRTLFHESYLIAEPGDRRPLPDPVAASLPARETLYAYQRDSSFGRNVLELTYTATDEGIRLRMRNLTRMHYQGVLPVVAPQSLEIDLVVVPAEGHLLFYGVAAARPVALFGLEERIERSFATRIEALYLWFLDQVS